MSETDGIKRFSRRAGFRLADVVEVALPVYSLNVTVLTLAHKRVSPINEFVLRSIAMGMSAQEDIIGYLGLPVEVIRPALAVLAQEEQIALTAVIGRNAWVITAAGKKALETAMFIVAEERSVPVVFDGLLRKVISLKTETLLEFKNLKDEGRYEVQLSPPRRPVLADMSASEIERLLAAAGSNEQQQRRDVLCIRGIEAKTVKKRFTPAIALLFVGLEGDDVQLGFVVGNRLSEEHATVFAGTKAFRELVEKFRTASGQAKAEAAADSQPYLLDNAHPPVDESLEAATEDTKLEIATITADLANASKSESEDLREKLASAESKLAEYEQRLSDAGFRYLSVLDHPPLLADTIRTAKERILIISPWISGAVVNSEFIRALESSLRRGVETYIGYGISGDQETKPIEQNYGLKQLTMLSQRHASFHLKRLGNTHAKVLIKDREFCATSSFNWLSFKGESNRTFRDEQGVLIREQEAVERKFQELLVRFE